MSLLVKHKKRSEKILQRVEMAWQPHTGIVSDTSMPELKVMTVSVPLGTLRTA